MSLSYALRLLCVVTVVAGFVCAAAQVLLAIHAGWILRRLEARPTRSRERFLYLLQIGPALLAAFVALAVCLPSYIRSEPGDAPERVSALCLLAAALVAMWFALAALRGARATLRALRFARACRRSGQRLSGDQKIPVLAVPGCFPPIALAGFFRTIILVSSNLAGRAGSLEPGAFELALAHEHSHARHHDNWKLLSLAFLPRIDRLLADPWKRPWKLAADCAADDDAVGGDPTRSLLLAEALLAAARAGNAVRGSRDSGLCSALTSAEAGLTMRMQRLIHPRFDPPASGSPFLPAIATVTLLAAISALAFSPWIYTVTEALLHLGAG
jgi:hypothetical protein